MNGNEPNDPNSRDSSARLPVDRRHFLAAGVGAIGLATTGSADDSNESSNRGHGSPHDHNHDGSDLGVEKPVSSITAREVNNVGYVDVTEGAAAAQEVVNEANAEGHNKVVVYGNEGEWNTPIDLPSDFTLEFRPSVTVTSSMTAEDADTWEVGAGTTAAALIRNADRENGNKNITIKGGFIDFSGVETDEATWAPVWLHDCENSRFDSIRVENVSGRGGVMFSDCRNSIMNDCVTRNIGYDGIALTLDCRHCDVYRCEAYECSGPGIQAATFGQGAGAPRDVNFINCRTDENIAVHGYEIAGGARNVTIHGCTSRRVSMIGEVNDFRISDCDVDVVSLSSLDETIRNGRIDSVTMSERFVDEDANTAVIFWTFGGLIENITFSNCTAHTHGHIERFAETRLTDVEGTVRYVDFTNCAFDGDGYDETRFIQHTPDGEEDYLQSVGALSNIRIQDSKIWNVDTVIEGEVDGVRIRQTEFHEVDEDDLHDGSVTDLETHQNDWW